MSIEERIRAIKENATNNYYEYDDDFGVYKTHQEDIEFLLEQNQRLVEEIERQSNVIDYLKVDVKTYMDGGLEKRRLIVKQEKQIESLQRENQRLVEALERADKAFQRLSTGDFNAPMELSQIEAYQAYAASAHQWLQAYKLLERKEK